MSTEAEQEVKRTAIKTGKEDADRLHAEVTGEMSRKPRVKPDPT